MGDRFDSGIRTLQFFIRGLQFAGGLVIFSINSYFLVRLGQTNLSIATSIRAVEGITGVSLLYAACACVLLHFVVGNPVTSFLTIALDFAFLCSYVYVAVANRGGASSCDGKLTTPFGTGDADKSAKNGVPTFRDSCRMLTACMSTAIIIIFLYVFSILVEVRLARLRHREKRFGPGGLPPSKVDDADAHAKFSPMRWFQMHEASEDSLPPPVNQPQTLPDAQPEMGYATQLGRDEESVEPRRDEPPLMSGAAYAALPNSSSALSLRGPSPPPPVAAVAAFPPSQQQQQQQHNDQPYDPAYSSVALQPLARVDSWRAREQSRQQHQQQQYPIPSLRPNSEMLPPGPRYPLAVEPPLRRMDSMPMQVGQISAGYDALPQGNLQRPPLQRTNSVPYGLNGPYDQPPPPPRDPRDPRNYPLPSGYLAVSYPAAPTVQPAFSAPYPDTRFLRPDLHPPRPDVPYPDDQSERVPYPGEGQQGVNYHDDSSSMYSRPR